MADDIELLVDDDVADQDKIEVLNEEQKERLAAYLSSEYRVVVDATATRNQKVAKWRREVEAFSSDVPKNHPFKNASNVKVPLMQLIVEAAYTNIKGTFNARDKMWIVKSTKSGTSPEAEQARKLAMTLTDYLDILAKSPSDIYLEGVLADAIMDSVITGTTFPKVIWSKNSWKVRTNDNAASDREVVAHQGPEIVILPIERLHYKRGIRNLQTAPWIGCDISYGEPELRQLARRGIFDEEAVKIVLGAGGREQATESENSASKNEEINEDISARIGIFDITEFYVYWDVDEDGGLYDLIVHMHVPTNTILSIQYNSYGHRLITPLKFAHRQYSITGRGLGQKLEGVQSEVDSIHNMRNDNMKLANLRMVIARRGMLRGSALDSAYTGKIIEADVPREDVVSFQLGEVYPSSLQAESLTMDLGYRSAAINETMTGQPTRMLGTRDTARGQAMRLQTGSAQFDDIVAGMVRAFSTVGMMIVVQLIAHREEVIGMERLRMRLSDEQLTLLDEALSIPIEDISTKFNFSVQTQDIEQSMEIKRQNLLTLTQLFTQFSTQTIPLAMQLMGPQGQMLMQQAPEAYAYMMRILTGAGLMMADVFKFFGEEDTQNYLPDFKKYDQILDTMSQMQNQLQMGGGMNGAQPSQIGGPVPGVPGGNPGNGAGVPQGGTGY